ncbi:ATP-binding cassette domain-containing protein, partial [Candidatus Protochlamydia amoebophila]|uniref:ATP-binding cassette domain-containing protein n=2 Tax=Candidatus Protochlamydia TaxID=282132 RepID=UPI00057FF363
MIRVQKIWKSYGKLQVLKGLDLIVNEGETLVILGRSGVGKSVLLKQIIGLETPDEG